MPSNSSNDIRDRTFAFGCDVARLALSFDARPGVRSIIDQLLRAGTGVGANLEEAKAASTRREFIRGTEISLREAREALYWLRICEALSLGPAPKVIELKGEADQIVRILTAIVISTKRRAAMALIVSAFCILTSALLMS